MRRIGTAAAAAARSFVTSEHGVTAAGKTLHHRVATVDALPDTAPRSIAMYMLSTAPSATAPPMPNSVAFVENNTSASVPHLMKALEASGAAPSDVRYIIVTHVHLDHAAGTGVLLEQCPKATVLCHPRARRHLVDPSALISSARRVYPPELHETLIGDMRPCDPDRVRAMEDNEAVELAPDRPLRFLHTEGHARHHMVVHDEACGAAFTGDSFGMTYDRLAPALPPSTFLPTTSPIDFDGPAAIAAVRRIAALPGLRWVFPTHYGACEDVASGATQLLPLLEQHDAIRVNVGERLAAGEAPEAVLLTATAAVRDVVTAHLLGRGMPRSAGAEVLADAAMQQTIDVNAQGLVVAAQRAARSKL